MRPAPRETRAIQIAKSGYLRLMQDPAAGRRSRAGATARVGRVGGGGLGLARAGTNLHPMRRRGTEYDVTTMLFYTLL